MNAAQLFLCMTLSGPARNPPSSSLELVQRTTPPSASTPCVHSQYRSCLRPPDTFDRPIPSNRFVPSSPFLTTSTACSARSFAGLLHPATNHGVRLVSGSSSHLPATDRGQSTAPSTNDRSHCLPATALRVSCLPSEDDSQLPRRLEEMNQGPFPQAHPPFEAFPSDSAVPGSPPECRVATSPSATAWPTLHVVAQCALLPCSTKIVADVGFPWRPGHLAQPQGFEPSPSPLHQHIVADVPMPVAPLGFSDTGSPAS